MAFPVSLNPASPAGSDSPAQGDDQLRAIKQALADLFGLPVSPTSISAALQVVDSTGRWAMPIRLTNKTGGGVVAGNCVAIDADNDEAVDLGDTVGSLKRFVIAQQTIANNAAGLFALAGYTTCTAQGTITRGHYVQKSATSLKVEDTGVALSDTSPAPRDAMGLALTADSAGSATVLWWGGYAGGSAGSGFVRLPIEGATLPDASGSGNNPPEIVREVSSGTQTGNSPKRTITKAKFDAATDEHLCWTLIIPSDYGSGGTLRLIWKATSATSGATFWKGSIAVSVDSTTDDDAVVFNTVTGTSGTAPASQGQPLTTSITLTTTNMAANRLATIFVGRDADGTLGTDDMTGDAELLAVFFEYS